MNAQMCSMRGDGMHRFEGRGWNGFLCLQCGALLDLDGKIYPATIVLPDQRRPKKAAAKKAAKR